MDGFDHNSGKHYQIDDARIYYEIKGDDAKPVLLLLHGGFGNIEDFNSEMPYLVNNYRVIGMDSRGQGKSTRGSEKLTYELIQKDAETLLIFLNIQELSIMGFSDGGIVGYRLATFSKLNIKKLVTIGSRWRLGDALQTKALFLRLTPESWKSKFPEMCSAYERLNPEADFNKIFHEVIAMWLDEETTGYPNELVKKYTNPLLIVRGDMDHLISLKTVTDLRMLIDNSVLLNIPYAGHATFTDQPEIFKITLQQFLDHEK